MPRDSPKHPLGAGTRQPKHPLGAHTFNNPATDMVPFPPHSCPRLGVPWAVEIKRKASAETRKNVDRSEKNAKDTVAGGRVTIPEGRGAAEGCLAAGTAARTGHGIGAFLNNPPGGGGPSIRRPGRSLAAKAGSPPPPPPLLPLLLPPPVSIDPSPNLLFQRRWIGGPGAGTRLAGCLPAS